MLRQGQSGLKVKKLQEDLNRLHFKVGVADGQFGARTADGVKRLQKAYGLKQTGNAGTGVQNRIKRGGKLSTHFHVNEFYSKGNGDLLLDRRLIQRLERLRKALGTSIKVTPNGGYRDPAHNKAVGGKPLSQHQYGKAADIQVPGKSIPDIIHAAAAVGFNGIGRYSTFVHVDVRDTPARWTG